MCSSDQLMISPEYWYGWHSPVNFLLTNLQLTVCSLGNLRQELEYKNQVSQRV